METGNTNYESEKVDFDIKEAIEKDPTAKMIYQESSRVLKDWKSPEYRNMIKFIRWLQLNKPEATNTFYFHLVFGSTPWETPKANDLTGEYSIEKFVRDGFPNKSLS